MGLGNNESTTWLTARAGKLCMNVPEGTPKCYPKLDKNGNPTGYFEVRYDLIEGILIGIELRERTHEGNTYKSWLLTFLDEHYLIYKVEMNYSSSYAKRFLNCSMNLKMQQPFMLKVWKLKDKETDKEIQGSTCWQDGQKVPPIYTKENPGSKPEMVQVPQPDGSLKWDDAAEMAFYERLVAEMIVPQLKDPRRVTTPVSASGESASDLKGGDNNAVPAGIAAGDVDDLPF